MVIKSIKEYAHDQCKKSLEEQFMKNVKPHKFRERGSYPYRSETSIDSISIDLSLTMLGSILLAGLQSVGRFIVLPSERTVASL